MEEKCVLAARKERRESGRCCVQTKDSQDATFRVDIRNDFEKKMKENVISRAKEERRRTASVNLLGRDLPPMMMIL